LVHDLVLLSIPMEDTANSWAINKCANQPTGNKQQYQAKELKDCTCRIMRSLPSVFMIPASRKDKASPKCSSNAPKTEGKRKEKRHWKWKREDMYGGNSRQNEIKKAQISRHCGLIAVQIWPLYMLCAHGVRRIAAAMLPYIAGCR